MPDFELVYRHVSFVRAGAGAAGGMLFPDVFQEYCQKKRREPEISAAAGKGSRRLSEELVAGAESLSYLQMSFLRAEDPDSQGQRKDLHYLPQVPERICEEELMECLDIYG